MSVTSIDDGFYRNRLKELNEEIIDLKKKNEVLNKETRLLNDELAIVGVN